MKNSRDKKENYFQFSETISFADLFLNYLFSYKAIWIIILIYGNNFILFHKLLEKYTLSGQRNVSVDSFLGILNGIFKIQGVLF